MTAIAIQHRDEIIALVASGKRLSDISAELGLNVSPQAISHALKDDPDYQGAAESYHSCRLDAAERGIDAAADSVDVARARAAWSSVAWRAEREFPHRWGQRTQVTHVDGDLAARIEAARGRLIEGECCADAESSAASPVLPAVSDPNGASD